MVQKHSKNISTKLIALITPFNLLPENPTLRYNPQNQFEHEDVNKGIVQTLMPTNRGDGTMDEKNAIRLFFPPVNLFGMENLCLPFRRPKKKKVEEDKLVDSTRPKLRISIRDLFGTATS